MLSVSGQEQIEENHNQKSWGGTTNFTTNSPPPSLSGHGAPQKSRLSMSPRQQQLGILQAKCPLTFTDPTSLPVSRIWGLNKYVTM